jgi:hypothetical protein
MDSQISSTPTRLIRNSGISSHLLTLVAQRLSTWETTLRDRLGVMERLKKEHWRLLYHEYERRGQRPFDLYANDDLVYPWNKVSKEFRRRRNLPLPQSTSVCY